MFDKKRQFTLACFLNSISRIGTLVETVTVSNSGGDSGVVDKGTVKQSFTRKWLGLMSNIL